MASEQRQAVAAEHAQKVLELLRKHTELSALSQALAARIEAPTVEIQPSVV